jgi:Holliday junction resolvase RusA-like endonuclease
MLLPPWLTIILAETPRGKGRPRGRIVKTRGGRMFISFYTDAETRSYEARLQAAAAEAMRDLDILDEALSVLIEAFMPIPASWSQRKQRAAADGEIFPTTKPDWDNLGKPIDALNKIVWTDDSLIVRGTVQKAYYVRPLLRISVWKWNQ